MVKISRRERVLVRMPRAVVRGDEILVPVVHSNQRQMRLLRRQLDGSRFHVKAITGPESLSTGSYVLILKLKPADDSEGHAPAGTLAGTSRP
jgi:hypothetical protein